MISYELAKQLKDAGFPQIFSTQKIPMFYVDKVLGYATLNFNGMELGGTNVYCPTLSELIEAWNVFMEELKHKDQPQKKQWLIYG